MFWVFLVCRVLIFQIPSQMVFGCLGYGMYILKSLYEYSYMQHISPSIHRIPIGANKNENHEQKIAYWHRQLRKPYFVYLFWGLKRLALHWVRCGCVTLKEANRQHFHTFPTYSNKSMQSRQSLGKSVQSCCILNTNQFATWKVMHVIRRSTQMQYIQMIYM